MNYDLGRKGPVRWSGGALSAVEGQSSLPFVRLFGRDGIQLAALAVIIPRAKIVSVLSVARGRNGLVAIVGGAGYAARMAEGPTTAFIALYPPDGSVQKTIPISYEVYSLRDIAVAEDGSIWTVGIPSKDAPDRNVFWHFDPLGNKIGSVVDFNSFSSRLAVHSGLFAASPRGVTYISPEDGRYLELSPAGVVTTDIAVKFPSNSHIVSGLSVTEDGQTFVQVQTRNPFHLTIYSIDRKTGNLTVLVDSPDFMLLGAEGNSLMGHAGTRIVSVNILP
jgi:hypothetical protein